jgi:aspartate ammonia-lyase
VFVEVSGIVRSLASNLLKISNDLRLLSSGPHAGIGELQLPAKQAGSSIMPGKVNPVIPEAVGQAALSMTAHDAAVLHACSLGNLELNQFMPLIADSLLTSLALARHACRILAEHCIDGVQANRARCSEHVDGATATITALVGAIGYQTAQAIATEAQASGRTIRQIVLERKLLTSEEFDQAISPAAVMQLGSRPENETT